MSAGTEHESGRACEPLSGSAPAGLVLNKTSVPRHYGGDLDVRLHAVPIATSKEGIYERRMARLCRSVWWAGQGHRERFSGLYGDRAWFVTLTYRPGIEWAGQHVSAALRTVRKWLKRQCGGTLRYVWVAEMQKRGAIHYHLVIWLPKHLSMPKWDKRGWWPYGMTNVQRVKEWKKGNGIGYLMKYVSKFSVFHEFPKGARIYGIGGLNEQATEIRRWKNLPQWCREAYGVGEVARKACGLVVRATGEILASPWVVLRGGGQLCMYLTRPLPKSIVGGPWSSLKVQPSASGSGAAGCAFAAV